MDRQLQDILSSGEINELRLELLDVKPEIQALLAEKVSEKTYGHVLAVTTGADANLGAIFFNTDNQRVCWKSQGGLVFKLGMSLI